ncbi:MAG: LLM class flavin-dependent oxidoreductase, partial [Gammaproteobacteria bacterium]|nr:LLM class flavin-dependent oxidoreductase [Gammaproteobacteria bacterium]NIR97688.1 LLM class flavin-dependent oxidoreductase [Gammaproteobacteria bacterium]
GELGDGVVINLFPAEALPKMMERVAEGARRAGKDAAAQEVVCRHQVIVTGDRAAAREVVRKSFLGYYA